MKNFDDSWAQCPKCGYIFTRPPEIHRIWQCPSCSIQAVKHDFLRHINPEINSDQETAKAGLERATVGAVYSGGGTRSSPDQPDWEAMLSPDVMEFYAQYMFYNSFVADGSRREEDNWQKGIPASRWMKSLWRHMTVVWREHRGRPLQENVMLALGGMLFNTMGYIHTYLRSNPGMLIRMTDLANDARREWLAKQPQHAAQENQAGQAYRVPNANDGAALFGYNQAVNPIPDTKR